MASVSCSCATELAPMIGMVMAFTQRPIISSAVPSHRRLDILVEAEQVRRVVLVLQGDQPFVLVGAIGRSDPILVPPIQVVDVGRLAFIWSHRLPEVSRPPDVLLGLRRVGPL